MKIGVVGCTGRVGQVLVNELLSPQWIEQGLSLAGGTSRRLSETNTNYYITDEAENLFQRSDVVIDFTLPEGTRHHAKIAAQMKKTLIVGTTGLSAEDEEFLKDAAKSTVIIYSANMSVGVNLLLSLVEKAAQTLGPEWDIEIFEAHHRHKVDAPSGTALALGRSAAIGRNTSLETVAQMARSGKTGPRESGKIGFSVARGGDVVGEHMVTFYADGERLELGHKATDRTLFARGALRAALWSKEKPSGLYSMKDVLGL